MPRRRTDSNLKDLIMAVQMRSNGLRSRVLPMRRRATGDGRNVAATARAFTAAMVQWSPSAAMTTAAFRGVRRR